MDWKAEIEQAKLELQVLVNDANVALAKKQGEIDYLVKKLGEEQPKQTEQSAKKKG